jgi:hypothetical protein
MNKAIRWRIISLQAMLVLILASASGFLFYEGSFVTGMVHDQLAAQQIFFPPSSQIKAGGALDPAEFPAELRQYAGQQLVNGDQAKAYANDFINKHLQSVAGGLTYAGASTKAQADPTNTVLAGQVATLFKGETLRSMLLNAYAWWTIGVYTTYAGVGLMIAALVVLGALVFEFAVAGRKPESIKVVQKLAA